MGIASTGILPNQAAGSTPSEPTPALVFAQRWRERVWRAKWRALLCSRADDARWVFKPELKEAPP